MFLNKFMLHPDNLFMQLGHDLIPLDIETVHFLNMRLLYIYDLSLVSLFDLFELFFLYELS